MASSKSTKSKEKTEKSKAGGAVEEQIGSRVDEYARLARRYAEEACIMLPDTLVGQARREHVRRTLDEDHHTRVANHDEEVQTKFAKLSGSLFSFFRGTALLFYRDMAGRDGTMPTVLALGDVHPENFGVMPNTDNVPIFTVNDFDEVQYAPFTWDLKRGAVGFALAADEVGGYGKKKQRKIVRKFIKGYYDGMARYAESATEKNEEFRRNNSPKVLRRLFKEAWEDREKWLWEDYRDDKGHGFRPTDELTPITSRKHEFQGYIDELAKSNDIDRNLRTNDLTVKDVAIRHGQGTASLGLARYYVLIEGPSKDATDDIIVEFKRARRSALQGLTPPSVYEMDGHGDRIQHGQAVHIAHGDVFYGSVDIDGQSFMTRERAPYRDDIDLDELSTKSWKHYAYWCGRALAQAHAMSDDAGKVDYDVEPRILEAMTPKHLFVDDMVVFAHDAAERLRGDHKWFKRDLELGAFRKVEKTYR